ncbi:YeeE/YedE thiosulfate transporter family protein [Oleispirillum naphthae]|uniref:YeeE/YedE thiosulfate transporter family protein n=1 Tax=Oleispirillum naphthae TaxID=2838853 RepID=UPI0030826827
MSETSYDENGLSPHCPWRKSRSLLRRAAWSPYAAGGLIGLLQIPAFLLVNTALGASSSFVTVGGHIAALFDAGAMQIGYFAGHAAGAKNWWQVALVAGIALGAFLSSRLSGTKRAAVAPVWKRATGVESFAGRAAMAFAGGFILLIGARLAGGCTSGHGISGIAQLAVSSMIAVAFMFAGGIATAMLFRKV